MDSSGRHNLQNTSLQKHAGVVLSFTLDALTGTPPSPPLTIVEPICPPWSRVRARDPEVYDEADNMIEPHEHAGEFKERQSPSLMHESLLKRIPNPNRLC